MRRVLRLAQARAGLSNEVRDTRCRKSRCVRIHRAIPQPEDAAKTRQAGSEVLNPFTTVRDFGVEPIATAPNQVWSMDFVSDALANARRLKSLTVADDFT